MVCKAILPNLYVNFLSINQCTYYLLPSIKRLDRMSLICLGLSHHALTFRVSVCGRPFDHTWFLVEEWTCHCDSCAYLLLNLTFIAHICSIWCHILWSTNVCGKISSLNLIIYRCLVSSYRRAHHGIKSRRKINNVSMVHNYIIMFVMIFTTICLLVSISCVS